MKVFLNPGHGGSDPGAVSKSGTKEKDVSLKICNILAEKLKAKGFSVVIYQQKESYFEITKHENVSGANLFVSVHCNSFNATSNGIETLYYPKSASSKKFAQDVQNALVKDVKLFDRGIKPREDLHVLKSTKATAILVECAFISNPKEEKLLKDNPAIFANAICEGICQYCK